MRRPYLAEIGQDMAYGLRLLVRNRVSSLFALTLLALGVGANTAIFSLWKDAWLDRLPVVRPQELVQVIVTEPPARWSQIQYPETRRWLDEVKAFDSILLYKNRELNVSFGGGGISERVRGRLVSGGAFAMLGVGAAAGRVLTPDDDRPSAPPVAMISHELWARRFGRDPAVLGRALEVGGAAVTIVGVTPAGFFGVDRLYVPEVTLPLSVARPISQDVQCVARLAPGISPAQAQAELTRRLRSGLDNGDLPQTASGSRSARRLSAQLEPARAGTWDVRLRLSEPMGILAALAVLMVLITGVNLGGLVQARTAARTRELGLRLATGASHLRLARQLLVESSLLGAIGGLAGLPVAFGLHRWLVALLPLGPGTALPFRLDTRMLAFNTSVSVLAGVLVGIAPALRALRLSPAAVFGAEAPARPRLGRLLRPALAAQVAASLVLLIGTAMFIRTLMNLLDVNTGFDSAHTLLVAIDPEECRLTPESTTALAEGLAARVRGLSGVRAVAIAAWADISDMSGSHKTMWADGLDKNVTVIDRAGFGVVSPQFFAATGVTLVAGRDFDARDRKGAPTVAIVNQAMAETYYRGANPIGRRIGDGPGRAAGMDTYEIVGVVGNARHGGLRRVPRPMVFHALAQQPDNRPFVLHVRGAGDPKALVAAVRASVHVTDPRLVIADTRTVSERLAESLRQERMFAVLSALFAGVGLVLSSVGLFAAAANAVQRRRREIGIRLALGAARDKVVALMLKETLVTVGAGAALGLPAAVFCASFLRSLLFGVAPTDIGVIVTAVATLVGAAALATFVPARRASRVDPAAALRCE